jgi:hypothetical protein
MVIGRPELIASLAFNLQSGCSGNPLIPWHSGSAHTQTRSSTTSTTTASSKLPARCSVYGPVPLKTELLHYQDKELMMTTLTTEPPRSEMEILRDCTDLLRDRLPDDWRVSVQQEPPDAGFDGVLTVTGPGKEDARFVVETKRLLVRRDVPLVSQRLRDATTRAVPDSQSMVMSRYLAPTVREALVAEGMSYIDATGNILVRASQPGLFVRDRGADRDPWRGPGRPRGTLAGEPAARVVRTLVGYRGPWSARDLVRASGASTGATYRVLEFLDEEGLVEKAQTQYIVTDWVRLLHRWSQDYGFLSSNRTFTYVEPRGIAALVQKLVETKFATYAVTGSVAAAQWAPYAPARSAMVYVADAAQAAAAWGVRPTGKGANLILAEPRYDIVFADATTSDEGYAIVAPEQTAVDLLTEPGRNPSEGEELISWMQLNESVWRRG